jgi:S-DNA-T family DNA segregation ATPase FtsK/SpoIIIE
MTERDAGGGRREGTPPPLFAVGGRGDPNQTEHLLAIPGDLPAPIEGVEGAVELEPEVLEGVLVDAPAPRSAGWMAERAGKLAEAPRIVPTWMRDRAVFSSNAAFVCRWYGHVWGYHGLRTPVYVTRLWLRAPRGAARLGGRWYRWVVDAQAQPVVSKAATGEVEQWMRLADQQTRRTTTRRKLTLWIGLPAAYAVYAAAFTAPTATWAIGGAVALTLLGAAGRQTDRPIVHRYVAIRMQRRLESPEVEIALEAIGVKGAVDWVNPIAIDGPGWLAELDLPGAFLADGVLEKRAELAAAMRRPLGCVWPEGDRDAHPGRLRLWVAREDPAKARRRLWPLMRDGQADLFKEIPYGFDPRGRPVTLRLMYSNVLIGGVMGSGKTSAVLVVALAGALDPACELWLYEMKGSGDLEPVRPVCHRYVSGDDDEDCAAALDALKALEKEMRRRKAVIKDLPTADVPEGRKTYPHLAARRHLGLHPLLAIFDECHTLFEHPEYGDQAAQVAGRLIRKARAYGIVVVFTTQKPDAKSIPRMVSDNAIDRILLAVTGHIPNDIIAGTGAYKRGVRGTMFDPERDAGTGWMVRGLKAQIVRAAFIKQEEAVRIGQRALALRIAAGTLSGEAAGEAIEDVDDTDLLDHLRVVWPAGEETMHSATLVEALAAYRPEAYGAWMDADVAGRSTMLAAALKPYRVATRQVQKRGAGGSAKGVRWEDLEAASEADLEEV